MSRAVAPLLVLALLGCAGPGESTAPGEASSAATDDRWWHGAWVVDGGRLQPDEALSPAARQTARALVATFADSARYELGPDGVRRTVADHDDRWRLAGASIGEQRVVLDLVGGAHLVLERGPDGVMLSDGAGSRPVKRP